MGTIIQSIQRNVATINNTITTINIGLGVPLTDLSRAELIFDCKTGQIPTNGQDDMWVTGRLTSTTNVRFERGGNTGLMTVHFHVIEYTVDSGVIVHRGTSTLSSSTVNVNLPALSQTRSYSRMFFKTTTNSNFQTNQMTHDITSDTNLQVVGNGADATITFDWQRIYMPMCIVRRFGGLATGTSFNIDLTGFYLRPDNTFSIVSNRYGGSGGFDISEFKGANLTSNTNCEIFSRGSASHYFTLQLVHRHRNRIERSKSVFSSSTFNVNWINPVDWNKSYVNLPVPNNLSAPTDSTTDASEFMVFSQLNGNSAITVSKLGSTKTCTLESEVVYVEGIGTPINSFYYTANPYRGAFRGRK